MVPPPSDQLEKLVPAVWIEHTTYRLQGGSRAKACNVLKRP